MPIKEKSLETSFYSLLISRLDGNLIGDSSYEKRIFTLTEKGIGGFILFGGRKHEVSRFIATLQSRAETPLFIASDIERGVHQQVTGYTPFPSQMAVAAAVRKDLAADTSLLADAVRIVADEAIDAGINMPLIPVLDVNRNPDNPIICTRAFSDSPEATAWFGGVYIRVLENAGLLSCAKHFPGHGDTSEDSHIELPVISKSLKDLEGADLVPFRRAIEAGVSSVMVGHLVVRTIDSAPASLSEKVIGGLLRKELGFDGLVMTDALNMHALKGIRNVPARCLRSEVDILLHPEDPDATVLELAAALKSRDITEEHVENAVARILRAKKKIGPREKQAVDWSSHLRLSSEITDRSITLVKSSPQLLPLSGSDRVTVVLAGDEKYFESSPLRTIFKPVFTLDQAASLLGKLSGEICIFAVFTSVSAWKGSSGIAGSERDLIARFIEEAGRSIVVSFGSPYILRHFAAADVLVAAYEPSVQAQKAAAACLKGGMKFLGRLPIVQYKWGL